MPVPLLVNALYESPPAPCATCALAKRCGEQELACARYHYYVMNPPPRGGARLDAWKRTVYCNQDNTDIPQRALHDDIFVNGTDDPTGRPHALTPEEKDAVRYQYSRGVTTGTLTTEFQVNRRTIWSITRGLNPQ